MEATNTWDTSAGSPLRSWLHPASLTLVAHHAIVSLEPDGTLHAVSVRAVPASTE